MDNLIWIIVAVVLIGLLVWILKKGGKKGPSLPKSSEGPPPPETPAM